MKVWNDTKVTNFPFKAIIMASMQRCSAVSGICSSICATLTSTAVPNQAGQTDSGRAERALLFVLHALALPPRSYFRANEHPLLESSRVSQNFLSFCFWRSRCALKMLWHQDTRPLQLLGWGAGHPGKETQTGMSFWHRHSAVNV